jgi:hypothetical protein
MRWSEELDLVLEEMRRVCAFMVSRAVWWIDQARIMEESRLRSGWSDESREGSYAYARRQASMFQDISSRCSSSWASTISYAMTIPRYNEQHVPGAALDTDNVVA